MDINETALLAINLGIFGLLWLIGTGKITYTDYARMRQWVKILIDRILYWMDHSIVGQQVFGLIFVTLGAIAMVVVQLIFLPIVIAKIIWEIVCGIAEWQEIRSRRRRI